jgi:hypothetical protein
MIRPENAPATLRRKLAAQVPQKMLRDLGNRLRFGAGAPLSDECIFVAPRAVRFVYRSDPKAQAPGFQRRHSGLVRGGDWDLSRAPLPETRAERVIRAHFEGGQSWEETGVVDYHLEKIAEKGISEGARNRAEIMARYEDLDRVYEEAQRTGRLRPRSELPGHLRREHGGIYFHIARDGEPLRAGGGRHRFAIARLLGLAHVPAQLGVIHPEALRAGLMARLRKPE